MVVGLSSGIFGRRFRTTLSVRKRRDRIFFARAGRCSARFESPWGDALAGCPSARFQLDFVCLRAVPPVQRSGRRRARLRPVSMPCGNASLRPREKSLFREAAAGNGPTTSYSITSPPQTAIDCPVMKDEAPEARNRSVPTRSSVVSLRLRIRMFLMAWRPSSVMMACSTSVSV